MIRSRLPHVLILSTALLAGCSSPTDEAPEPAPPEIVEEVAAETPIELPRIVAEEPVVNQRIGDQRVVETALTAVPATTQFTRFGNGSGPAFADGIYRLLDSARTPKQSNAIALDREHKGAYESVTLRGQLRVLEGGDGGSIVFLNTREYGARGAAPYVKSWVEPNLDKTFAVGIDVHNPPNEEPFGPWGNYQDLPEREVSLHWDGRELVKRVAPSEFRGDFADLEIRVEHVVGGADVTVRLGDTAVYDSYFIAGLLPYESRLAFGAATRADATTEFDVRGVEVTVGEPAATRRRPARYEVFNHVLTDNSKITFESEVDLPPAEWAFGRVILTLDIHDAGKMWDEWDRNGEISVWDKDGRKLGIVPFITSYRTECHWKVDVTHFRPLLTGKTKFEIRAGTKFYKNRGYMMSVSLDYYHGVPELEPYRVVPLWHGTAKYKTAENHFADFFEPQTVELDDERRAARVVTYTTGHSQVGEFTPSKRTLVVEPYPDTESGSSRRVENVLWKTDCYLNPNRPQSGTWKYSRAGWAPGDVVWPWWVDVSAEATAASAVRLSYEPTRYDFGDTPKPPAQKEINKASHVVRSYLIAYREPTAMSAAPSLQVGEVSKGGSAKKAGMKAGDYISEYDGQTIDSIDDLRAAVQAASEAKKESVAVVVFRGNERVEVQIATGRLGLQLRRR